MADTILPPRDVHAVIFPPAIFWRRRSLAAMLARRHYRFCHRADMDAMLSGRWGFFHFILNTFLSLHFINAFAFLFLSAAVVRLPPDARHHHHDKESLFEFD